MLTDIIVIGIILLIIALALIYLINSKKKGRKCIGCPYCDSCKKKNTKYVLTKGSIKK